MSFRFLLLSSKSCVSFSVCSVYVKLWSLHTKDNENGARTLCFTLDMTHSLENRVAQQKLFAIPTARAHLLEHGALIQRELVNVEALRILPVELLVLIAAFAMF